jgi:uncharacterized protein HemX
MPIPHDRESPGLEGPAKHGETAGVGLAGSVLGFAAGAVGLVLAFTVSLVLVAVLLTAGLAFGGWFWWNTRKLRQQLREQVLQAQRPGEREVEGIVVELDADDPDRRG